MKRRSRDDEARSDGRVAVVVVAAIVVGLGAAIYAGLASKDREPAALKPAAPIVVGDYPSSVPVSILPAPPSSAALPPIEIATSRPPAPTTPATPAKAADRPATPVWEQRVISATSVLTTGQSWSTNRLKLTVTASGNLVLQDQGRTVWQTGTTTGVKLVMQNDGHLVLYDAGGGTAFSSGTAGNPGAVLILHADGTMVIALGDRVLFRAG